ncbi:transmembrane protein 94-like isoform X2 [Antedon mediterranea]|uniref:transmembrane protein 94-like isoform X2 n=1 Tax=Antedon mediterranea TaxID=105859 RepID=UPI003AF7F0E6
MMDEEIHVDGLPSSQALQKLHNAIQNEIQLFQDDLRKSQSILANLSQPSGLWLSHRSPLHWLRALFIFIASVVLTVAYGCSGNELYVIQALILLVLLTLNVYVTGWDHKLQRNEMVRQGQRILKYIKECIENREDWTLSSYPSLHSPFTKSFGLLWTYRDGKLVNLPSALLVQGDTVLIRPGQVVPARLKHTEKNDLVLNVGDRYEPESAKPLTSTMPTAKTPLKPNCFEVLETPYLRSLRVCLNQALNRPVSVLENKRIMCTRVIHVILPIIFVISLFTNIGRYFVLTEDVGDWPDMVLVLPIYAIMPLLPLFFPMCWVVINAYGVARLVAVFNKALKKTREVLGDELEAEKEVNSDDYVNWKEVWEHFKCIISGSSSCLPRTSNLFHALGSMTVFSCVDKRGILSQPDPSVERVFFLTGLQPDNTSIDSVFSPSDEHSEHLDGDANDSGITVAKKPMIIQDVNGEILGLSPNFNSDSKEIQFDEQDWEKHINSLKPMGLNILLNTCNSLTLDHHSQFIDHVYCAGNLHDNPLYIQQQSCLCQLARLIGFTDRAVASYKLQHQLASYRPIQKLPAEKSRIKQVQTFIKRKTPISHMMSVVVEDLRTDMQQLLTQGTADFVMEACTDFWDGSDICPIFENHRKKIMDFYQRQCLASYCWAFSYRPMMHSLANYLENCFIEVPNQNKQCLSANQYESPHISRASWNGSRNSMDLIDGPERPYHSLDSAMDTVGDIRDAEGCYRAQCGQIFIGMVSCNFQAKSDIVNLLDNLDEACIRFVHFSRDQELRSKVFSEKIGLETGWNCHISLLSDEETSIQTSRQASESSSKTENVQLDMDTGEATYHAQEDEPKEDVVDNVINDATERDHPVVDDATERNHLVVDDAIKRDHPVEDASVLPVVTIIQPSCKNSPDNDHKDFEVVDGISERSVLLPQPLTIQDIECHNDRNTSGESESTGLLLNRSPVRHGEQKHVRLPSPSLSDSVSLDRFNNTRHMSETFSETDYETESVTDPGSTGFDIFNRAKLPRGIRNIRPHLENVDNVPLLVPLFTDVTPETTREMLQIMQEYGEVVCCIGSSLNVSNAEIFMQANASLALDPLLPSTCCSQPAHQSLIHMKYSPLDITRQLASLPCCLNFHTDDNVRLTKLIKEAILIYTVFFIVKFLSSVCICLLCEALTLHEFCIKEAEEGDICHVLLGNRNNSEPFNGLINEYSNGYLLTQNLVAFFLVLYFVVVSTSYVHRFKSLVKKRPFGNKIWCVATILVLVLQAIYFALDVLVWWNTDDVDFSLYDIPFSTWLIALLWPLILLPLCEAAKYHDIQVFEKWQKRTKLQFGTKLGMNSPF